MTASRPEIGDYLALMRLYGGRRIHALEVEDVTLLFEQTLRLLARASPFNDTLPPPFHEDARRHVAGDAALRERLADNEIRQFFLSDLYDYIHLMQLRAERAENGF
ncbi:MAG: hypothetical protein PHI49_05445 [Halothiobacillaceae bacterium]|nr:hypothetical protein [Halothiobacillaceae bacterium]